MERAGLEAAAIERDVLKADGLEALRDFLHGGNVEHGGHFVEGDFDAGDVAVMPHAELAQAEAAQEFLGLLDVAEGLGRDGKAVGDARGEAGGGGLVPDLEAGGAGSSRMSALVISASTSGARTSCISAASWPGRKSPRSSRFMP